MTEDILDKYVRYTMIIENIQGKINDYKKYIEKSVKRAKLESDRDAKLREFKNVLIKIKEDPYITKKYRFLKKKQHELRTILLQSTTTLRNNKNMADDNNTVSAAAGFEPDIDLTLNSLKNKYENDYDNKTMDNGSINESIDDNTSIMNRNNGIDEAFDISSFY
jgi:hypothetical protein